MNTDNGSKNTVTYTRYVRDTKPDRSKVWRVLILILIAVLAVFPKITQAFQTGTNLWEKLLSVPVIIGGMFLIWAGLAVFSILLSAVCWWLMQKFLGVKPENKDAEQKSVETVIVAGIAASAVIVLAAQFIDSWGIKADAIRWAITTVFPFV